MNINVLVVNVPRDFWPSDAREREDYARTSSRPETGAPVEEVIELLPQDGAWVGKRELKPGQGAGYQGTRRDAKALNPTAPIMTYDHKGRVNRPSPDRGLYINITA